MNEQQKQLLAEINIQFANSAVARAANLGQWAEAAEQAAGAGAWGLWAACRKAASLPSDATAAAELLAVFKVREKARFANRR